MAVGDTTTVDLKALVGGNNIENNFISVEHLPGEGFGILFTEFSGSNRRPTFVFVNEDGTVRFGPITISSTTDTVFIDGCRILPDGSGFGLVWREDPPLSGDTRVMFSFIDLTGSFIAPVNVFAAFVTSQDWGRQTIVASDDGFGLFYSAISAPHSGDYYFRHMLPTGSATANPVVVDGAFQTTTGGGHGVWTGTQFVIAYHYGSFAVDSNTYMLGCNKSGGITISIKNLTNLVPGGTEDKGGQEQVFLLSNGELVVFFVDQVSSSARTYIYRTNGSGTDLLLPTELTAFNNNFITIVEKFGQIQKNPDEDKFTLAFAVDTGVGDGVTLDIVSILPDSTIEFQTPVPFGSRQATFGPFDVNFSGQNDIFLGPGKFAPFGVMKVQFSSDGTLPPGLSPSTDYFAREFFGQDMIVWDNIGDAQSFNTGNAVNLSGGGGSGTHTATYPVYGDVAEPSIIKESRGFGVFMDRQNTNVSSNDRFFHHYKNDFSQDVEKNLTNNPDNFTTSNTSRLVKTPLNFSSLITMGFGNPALFVLAEYTFKAVNNLGTNNKVEANKLIGGVSV